jgi:glycosyltransferase involved in cell wall biosynthesis
MKKKHTIAIDGRYLSGPKRGINQYVKNLIQQISFLDSSLNFIIFTHENFKDSEILIHKNVKFIKTIKTIYPIWEHIVFPLYAYHKGAKLIHFTANTGGWILSKLLGLKIIVTIHDTYFMKNKKYYPQASTFRQLLGSFYRKLVVKKLALYSNKIITVSNFAKFEIHKYLNINLSKIVVINNVLDPRYLNLLKKDQISKKENIVLIVGGDHPQKNVIKTIDLLDSFCSDILDNWKIVICGLSKTKEKLNSKKIKIITYDHLDETKLFELYKISKILLFPSLSESFGIPLIEALATKNQVVAMDAGAVREVIKNYGYIYKYNNGRDLKIKLSEAINIENYIINDDMKKYLTSFSNNSKKDSLLQTYSKIIN